MFQSNHTAKGFFKKNQKKIFCALFYQSNAHFEYKQKLYIIINFYFISLHITTHIQKSQHKPNKVPYTRTQRTSAIYYYFILYTFLFYTLYFLILYFILYIITSIYIRLIIYNNNNIKYNNILLLILIYNKGKWIKRFMIKNPQIPFVMLLP